jgi:endonuclease YncB( thermonuclease family)
VIGDFGTGSPWKRSRAHKIGWAARRFGWRTRSWRGPLILLSALCLLILVVQGTKYRGLPWMNEITRSKAASTGAGSAISHRGWPHVIDGDTIELNGRRIRLDGIDAPESDQTCQQPSGLAWACGRDAANALSSRIGWSHIRCEGAAYDRYGRLLARCFLGNEDLNRWMVAHGWAVVYRQYSSDYLVDETQARQSRLGLWSGRFAMPWDWRRGDVRSADH